MDVLHYVPNYIDPKGGREIFVRGLVQHLRKYNINQTIVTYSSDNPKKLDVIADDPRIIYLQVSKIGDYAILHGLMHVLREKKYDIIHIHGYGEYAGDLSCLLKRLGLLNSRLLLTTHGLSGLKNAFLALNQSQTFTLFQRLRRIIHFTYDFSLGKLGLDTFDKIILLSNEERECLARIARTDDRYTKIPIAVNDIFFNSISSNTTRKFVLYVGRIDAYKGLDTLIYALEGLQNQHLDVKCVIVGRDFGYRKNLEKLVTSLNLNHVVHIKEYVCQDELLDYYYSSFVTVLPSMTEGFPLVLVESMATGTPFISTPVGAVPELVVNSGAGLIVPLGDSQALADAIIKLSKDPKLWEELSMNGKKSSQNFRMEQLAKLYYQIYLELAG